jgi:hypothetical protein
VALLDIGERLGDLLHQMAEHLDFTQQGIALGTYPGDDQLVDAVDAGGESCGFIGGVTRHMGDLGKPFLEPPAIPTAEEIQLEQCHAEQQGQAEAGGFGNGKAETHNHQRRN